MGVRHLIYNCTFLTPSSANYQYSGTPLNQYKNSIFKFLMKITFIPPTRFLENKYLSQQLQSACFNGHVAAKALRGKLFTQSNILAEGELIYCTIFIVTLLLSGDNYNSPFPWKSRISKRTQYTKWILISYGTFMQWPGVKGASRCRVCTLICYYGYDKSSTSNRNSIIIASVMAHEPSLTL